MSYSGKVYEFLLTSGTKSYWVPCFVLNRYHDGKVLIEYYDTINKNFLQRLIDESLLTEAND